jgi:hypothetical protein
LEQPRNPEEATTADETRFATVSVEHVPPAQLVHRRRPTITLGEPPSASISTSSTVAAEVIVFVTAFEDDVSPTEISQPLFCTPATVDSLTICQEFPDESKHTCVLRALSK